MRRVDHRLRSHAQTSRRGRFDCDWERLDRPPRTGSRFDSRSGPGYYLSQLRYTYTHASTKLPVGLS